MEVATVPKDDTLSFTFSQSFCFGSWYNSFACAGVVALDIVIDFEHKVY